MQRLWHSAALLLLCLAAASCKEEGAISVHSLSFKGVKAVDVSALKSALATRAGSWVPFSKKRYFDRMRFDADRKRVEAFYADRGYPDARVTGFDVILNGKQDAVDITLTISEGEPIKVAAIDFAGLDVIPAGHFDAMRRHVPLEVGKPRDRQLVVATQALALNELRDHGYPYSRVTIEESTGASGKEATLMFTAVPGTLAHFGAVEVSGNKSVGDRIIRREVSFQPGDLYRRSAVQETQRRLYGLDLFQFVNVEPLNQEAQPIEVPTRITVAEGKHQRVNFGVGYGTEDKGRVDAEYHHVNFLGGARSAGVHGRWSSLDRGVRLDFTQPYLFRPHLSFGAEAQQWYTFTPAYESIVSGGKATVAHSSSRHTSWAASMTIERDRSSITPEALADPTIRNDLIALGLDPVTGEQNGTLNALGFEFQHDTVDSLLDAHRGYQATFHVEQTGRLLPGTFKYTMVSLDGRHYWPLNDRFILASRAQVGNLDPPGGDQTLIPFSKLYFLGGATSVRGWGRYEISPLSGGLPIGGDSLMAFSEEIRAAVRGRLGAVVFLDGGNVWPTSWTLKLDDLRYAVGAGLRFKTGVGPLRVDFGYQLNPIPGLIVNGEPEPRRWRLHFSIGQAF